LTFSKGSLILVDYTSKVKDTEEVFETTIEEEAKKHSFHDPNVKYQPKLVSVGESWVIKGFDEALEKTSVGDKKTIEITPDKGFGERDTGKVRMIPLRKLGEDAEKVSIGDTVEVDKKRYNKMKSENQNQMIGGRKISEILNRFNNKIKDPRKFAEGKKTASIIREYLKISCSVNLARKKLNTFFSKYKIKIDLKDEFFPIKKQLGKNKIIFSTNFGRELEYYTGMVFNIKDQSNVNLVQGGRYDNLLSNLGSKRKIPAVGAAINLNSYEN